MSVNVGKLVLPIGRLPVCPNERRARLDAYFDDLLASVKAVSKGWEVDLNWPSTADYYVDPSVEQGLTWWQAGTQITDIHRQVNHTPRGQLSLNDSWTLYSWSNWLAQRRKNGEAIEEVVVLHIDDHTDLMTPRLTFRKSGWWNTISGETFDIYEPESVRSAILSGAVGVGSFMSPFIHTIRCVHLRHLSQTAPDEEAQDCTLVTERLADTLLDINAFRPAISITRDKITASDELRRSSAGQYRLTRQLDCWLGGLPDAPVLLHVDMDYFNNRYDRDSDWTAKGWRHDPDLPEILRAIDAMFKAINESGVAPHIENVTVALSPGFFPAELWAASIGRMQEHLARMGWEIRMPER